MMKFFIIAITGILFIGCTGMKPPMTEYRVNPIIPLVHGEAKGCSDKSIKIAQSFSPTYLMSNKMSYAQGDSKQYIYSMSQWSNSPNREINDEYLRLLRASKLFKSVQISKSRSDSDILMEIHIEDFMQYFDKDESSSHVNAVITISLIDLQTNKVLSSKTFESKVDTDSLDANGGVKSLNIALSKILFESNEWLIEVCK